MKWALIRQIEHGIVDADFRALFDWFVLTKPLLSVCVTGTETIGDVPISCEGGIAGARETNDR